MKHSLWEILGMAGGAMWVILAMSVIVLAVALDRAIAHWGFVKKARALHDTVTRCLGRGALSEARSACERSNSPLADVYLVGYERRGRVKQASVETAVHRERERGDRRDGEDDRVVEQRELRDAERVLEEEGDRAGREDEDRDPLEESP